MRAMLTFTFDDGDEMTLRHIFQLAQKYHFHATFNVITEKVGSAFEGRLLASWDLIRELAAQGHEIASHSATHPSFLSHVWDWYPRFLEGVLHPKLVLSRIAKRRSYKSLFTGRVDFRSEIIGSKKKIESQVANQCTSFAIPGGLACKKLIRRIFDAGYTSIRTSLRGYNSLNPSLGQLKVQVWNTKTTLEDANRWVDTALQRDLWLIEELHVVDETNPSGFEYFTHLKMFEDHLRYAMERGITIVSQVEALKRLGLTQPLSEEERFAKRVSQETMFFDPSRLRVKKELEAIFEPYPSPKVILDVGCADGVLVYALKRSTVVKTGDILMGSDLVLKRCRTTARNTQIPTFASDAHSYPLRDGVVDLITNEGIIAYSGQPFEFLREQNRILKHSGYLYITAPLRRGWNWYIYRRDGKYVLDPDFRTTFDREEDFLQLIEQAGFQIVHKKIIPHHYPLLDIFFRVALKVRLLSNTPALQHIYLRYPFLQRIRHALSFHPPGFYSIDVIAKKIYDVTTKHTASSQTSLIIPSREVSDTPRVHKVMELFLNQPAVTF